MFIETIKVILLFLVFASYLAVTMPAYIFLSAYHACESGFDYDESYLCYMAIISAGACYCFAEMIAYSTPMAHIYVMTAFYLLTCCFLGGALSLLSVDKPLSVALKSTPEATHYFLYGGKSLHFKYAGADQKKDDKSARLTLGNTK